MTKSLVCLSYSVPATHSLFGARALRVVVIIALVMVQLTYRLAACPGLSSHST